jgi:hypothetical protein
MPGRADVMNGTERGHGRAEKYFENIAEPPKPRSNTGS